MIRIDFFSGDLGGFPVETARMVGAGCFAVATADTPIVIDSNDTVRFLPSRLHWADLDARSVAALLALYRHVEFAFSGNGVVEVGIAAF